MTMPVAGTAPKAEHGNGEHPKLSGMASRGSPPRSYIALDRSTLPATIEQGLLHIHICEELSSQFDVVKGTPYPHGQIVRLFSVALRRVIRPFPSDGTGRSLFASPAGKEWELYT